jgi:hypothetical protein
MDPQRGWPLLTPFPREKSRRLVAADDRGGRTAKALSGVVSTPASFQLPFDLFVFATIRR